MNYTYSDELYSDLHKDAYGCRPSIGERLYWQTLSADEKQKEWDFLIGMMNARILHQREMELEAIAEYEQQIARNLDLGADSREDAIRWILDSMELSQYDDAGYVCYKLGLPYTMESEFADILADMMLDIAA